MTKKQILWFLGFMAAHWNDLDASERRILCEVFEKFFADQVENFSFTKFRGQLATIDDSRGTHTFNVKMTPWFFAKPQEQEQII